MVWDYPHRRDYGVWVKTPSGPFPDPKEIIENHEYVCERDQIILGYGGLRPLNKWTNTRT